MSEGIPRSKFKHYDNDGEIINQSPPSPHPEPASEEFNTQQLSTRKTKSLALLLTLVVILLVGGFGTWFYVHKNSSPIPKTVSQSVTFPIYYPDPKKLPSGYTLNLNSFRTPVKNGVTYTVNYDSGKNIVFSLQQKPSDSELQTFNGNFLALRIPYQTPVGQAELGAYNLKTLVSLPTNSNTWIIITAPSDINQSQLEQVLSSIKD